ncbi:MAG TPA: apolipoprotein N-acyltransferase [Sediminispirochaeta sp.]|nr:apolipoprotein N-acyltransferase [Sediminispirochaeta sp.]
MKFCRSRRNIALLPALIAAAELLLYFFPPHWAAEVRGTGDALFLAYITTHLMWSWSLLKHRGKNLAFDLFRIPEILILYGIAVFLFSYFFAANANLSYAQLYAQTSGNLQLAPNSFLHRLHSMIRYLPLLGVDLWFYFVMRLKKKSPLSLLANAGGPYKWSLLMAFLSGLLYALAQPSFVSLQGWGFLSFIALIPLWSIITRHSLFWGVFYGLSFSILQTLISTYWMGTFSLITLQLVVLLYSLEHLFFFLFLLLIAKRLAKPHLWFIPVFWVLFDFVRTQGFLGYPWGMIGSSLYNYTTLIQIASLGGIYAVSLFVLLTNGLLLESLRQAWPRFFTGHSQHLTEGYLRRGLAGPRSSRSPALLLLALWTGVILFGALSIRSWEDSTADETVRIALIQQNSDPRRSDYRESFDKLARLSRQALMEKPDLVAWPETAFVPNIRKWGAMERGTNSLTRLVHEFRDFQRELGVFLVTGNDDYIEEPDGEGELTRNHFNSSVFFSDGGERLATYHKMHLVPFSEYFPYRDQMPWVYKILKDFDLHLWEKGDEAVVFHHPEFSFITPICFEDSFPGEIQRFVAQGAELILNLSNDYWSMTEVQGQQHFSNSLFRAVENRRPLARATTSGLTAAVSPTGEILDTLPYYQEGLLIVDLPVDPETSSLYLRWGNWLIVVLALVVLAALASSFAPSRRRK